MNHKKHKITVLMLGGARRVSLGELLKQSGQRLDTDVNIVSYELMAEVPIAAIAEVVVGRKWTDEDVVDDICRVIEEKEVNIVLPFVDGAIEIAAKVKERMPELFIPVSDIETSHKMFDKVEAAAVFKEAGLPIPKTYSVINAAMPAIAKPRRGSASRGIKIFNKLEDLMNLQNLQDYLVQEYIDPCEEYTCDAYVAEDGRILTVVPRKRLEVMGGEVTRTVTTRDAVLEKMCRNAITALNLRGPVTLQFLHDLEADRYLLMEVNPRLGGGVVCSIHAGAPITDYILCEALDIPVRPCDDWVDHALMARYQKEVMFYR